MCLATKINFSSQPTVLPDSKFFISPLLILQSRGARTHTFQYRIIEPTSRYPVHFRRFRGFCCTIEYFIWLFMLFIHEYDGSLPFFYHTRWRSPIKCFSQKHNKWTRQIFCDTSLYVKRQTGRIPMSKEFGMSRSKIKILILVYWFVDAALPIGQLLALELNSFNRKSAFIFLIAKPGNILL